VILEQTFTQQKKIGLRISSERNLATIWCGHSLIPLAREDTHTWLERGILPA
jgi:hypothetical protein